MRELTAAEVMKVIMNRYKFVKERDDDKLYDDNVRKDELIIVMREILDKETEVKGLDEDHDGVDLMEEAEQLDG